MSGSEPNRPTKTSTEATQRKGPAASGKRRAASAVGGRPSKFTPEVRERVLSAVRAGVPQAVAAQSAGISETTLYRYLQLGRAQERGPYREFVEELSRAEADAQVHAVASWRRAIANGDWRAAESYLARRHPTQWSRRAGEQRARMAPGQELEAELGQLLRTGPEADLRKLSERQLSELEGIRRDLRR